MVVQLLAQASRGRGGNLEGRASENRGTYVLRVAVVRQLAMHHRLRVGNGSARGGGGGRLSVLALTQWGS